MTFPLIDDVSMEVATKYGMIMPGEDTAKAVRAVFFIDPEATVRAVIYYPLSLGRNFDELLRVIKGLQVADAFDVATPADWRPGERVIVPPAGSCGTAKDRMEGAGDEDRVRGLVLLHQGTARVDDRGHYTSDCRAATSGSVCRAFVIWP